MYQLILARVYSLKAIALIFTSGYYGMYLLRFNIRKKVVNGWIILMWFISVPPDSEACHTSDIKLAAIDFNHKEFCFEWVFPEFTSA